MAEQEVKKPQTPVPGVETIFEERAVTSDNRAFERARPHLFAGAVFFAFLLLILIYCFSPESRVKAVSVRGHNYLSKSYVEKRAGVSVNDLFYLQFPSAVAAMIEEDPMIEEAQVRLLHDNIIEITVHEKQPYGYRYDEEEPTVLCTDGSVVPLTSELMPILARIPFINGFTDEKATHLLTNGFKEVSPDRIEEMAEVIQYPLSYDPEAIEIRMRDGGIFFSNYFSLSLVNQYPTLSRLIKNKDNCLYADNGTTVAAARACPWDEEEIILEYWTDEEGNYIYNKWGDRAVKHYYQDSDGNYYLDDNGDRIIIPIDAYGQDQKDADFLNHYFLGWYKKGYLDIPEEELEEGENPEGTAAPEDSPDTEETSETEEEQQEG